MRAYSRMLVQDVPVGNYIEFQPDPNGLINTREQCVLLIEQLHEIKSYRVETLYLAVSLADRFLSKTISKSSV